LPCKAPGIGSAGAATINRVFRPMVRSEPSKEKAASATTTLQKVGDLNMAGSFVITPLSFGPTDRMKRTRLRNLHEAVGSLRQGLISISG